MKAGGLPANHERLRLLSYDFSKPNVTVSQLISSDSVTTGTKQSAAVREELQELPQILNRMYKAAFNAIVRAFLSKLACSSVSQATPEVLSFSNSHEKLYHSGIVKDLSIP